MGAKTMIILINMAQSLARAIKRKRLVIVRDTVTGGTRFERPTNMNRKNWMSKEEHDAYIANVHERARLDSYSEYGADGVFRYPNRVYVRHPEKVYVRKQDRK